MKKESEEAKQSETPKEKVASKMKNRFFYSPDLGRSIRATSNQEAKNIVNNKLK